MARQNYQCKTAAWIFVLLIIVNLICIIHAETIEDIRKKTDWQTPQHSERETPYIFPITPAELIVNLSKYHRDTIKMQVLFKEISSRGLNKRTYSNGAWHRWSSKRYIAFDIKDPIGQVKSKYFYTFISVKNPESDKLFSLLRNAKIIITGMVKDVENGCAWIEVEKIEL